MLLTVRKDDQETRASIQPLKLLKKLGTREISLTDRRLNHEFVKMLKVEAELR